MAGKRFFPSPAALRGMALHRCRADYRLSIRLDVSKQTGRRGEGTAYTPFDRCVSGRPALPPKELAHQRKDTDLH